MLVTARTIKREAVRFEIGRKAGAGAKDGPVCGLEAVWIATVC